MLSASDVTTRAIAFAVASILAACAQAGAERSSARVERGPDFPFDEPPIAQPCDIDRWFGDWIAESGDVGCNPYFQVQAGPGFLEARLVPGPESDILSIVDRGPQHCELRFDLDAQCVAIAQPGQTCRWFENGQWTAMSAISETLALVDEATAIRSRMVDALIYYENIEPCVYGHDLRVVRKEAPPPPTPDPWR